MALTNVKNYSVEYLLTANSSSLEQSLIAVGNSANAVADSLTRVTQAFSMKLQGQDKKGFDKVLEKYKGLSESFKEIKLPEIDKQWNAQLENMITQTETAVQKINEAFNRLGPGATTMARLMKVFNGNSNGDKNNGAPLSRREHYNDFFKKAGFTPKEIVKDIKEYSSASSSFNKLSSKIKTFNKQYDKIVDDIRFAEDKAYSYREGSREFNTHIQVADELERKAETLDQKINGLKEKAAQFSQQMAPILNKYGGKDPMSVLKSIGLDEKKKYYGSADNFPSVKKALKSVSEQGGNLAGTIALAQKWNEIAEKTARMVLSVDAAQANEVLGQVTGDFIGLQQAMSKPIPLNIQGATTGKDGKQSFPIKLTPTISQKSLDAALEGKKSLTIPITPTFDPNIIKEQFTKSPIEIPVTVKLAQDAGKNFKEQIKKVTGQKGISFKIPTTLGLTKTAITQQVKQLVVPTIDVPIRVQASPSSVEQEFKNIKIPSVEVPVGIKVSATDIQNQIKSLSVKAIKIPVKVDISKASIDRQIKGVSMPTLNLPFKIDITKAKLEKQIKAVGIPTITANVKVVATKADLETQVNKVGAPSLSVKTKLTGTKADFTKQIKKFKVPDLPIKISLGFGTGKAGMASQIKALSSALKPLPMTVELDTTQALAKLNELKARAASMSPLKIAAEVTGKGKNTTSKVPERPSATQMMIQNRNAKAFDERLSKAVARGNMIATQANDTKNNDLYSRTRKAFYPFAGNTSFGARTPAAIDMAKGMGMMFAVSGVMQTVTSAFSQVTEYENAMKTVNAILKTNDNRPNFDTRFKDMEDVVRKVGRETKFTAPEVAGAAKFMAMAGLNMEDINAATAPIANLALVGDNDLAETADKMTNIMTSFGLLKGLSTEQKRRNMVHTSDVLTNTFTKSNTNLLQLAEAMQYAGTMSHLSGTDLEDAAAMVGVMGNSGVQASMAGTTLRMMYRNIMKPTKGQTKIWDSLGVKRTDSKGRMRDIFDILTDLRAAITGSTDLNAPLDKNKLKQLASGTMDMFRATAASGTAAVLENLGEVKRLAQSNRAASGIAEQIADQKKNTIQGLWAQVTSTFTDQSVNTVSRFQQTIKQMLMDLRDWLQTEEAANTLKNIYDMGRSVIEVFGFFAKIWGGILNQAGGVLKTFIGFQFAMTQLGYFLGAGTQVLGVFTSLKNALFGLAGAATAANVAVAGGSVAGSVARGGLARGLTATAAGATATNRILNPYYVANPKRSRGLLLPSQIAAMGIGGLTTGTPGTRWVVGTRRVPYYMSAVNHGRTTKFFTRRTTEPKYIMPFNQHSSGSSAILNGAAAKADKLKYYGLMHQRYAAIAASAPNILTAAIADVKAQKYLDAAIRASKDLKMQEANAKVFKNDRLTSLRESRRAGQLSNMWLMSRAANWNGVGKENVNAIGQKYFADLKAAKEIRKAENLKNAAFLTRANSMGRLSTGNALRGFGTMMNAGFMAGQFKLMLPSIQQIFNSAILNVAKGLGMLVSPIGATVLALTAAGVAIWKLNSTMKKRTEDFLRDSKRGEAVRNSANSILDGSYSKEAYTIADFSEKNRALGGLRAGHNPLMRNSREWKAAFRYDLKDGTFGMKNGLYDQYIKPTLKYLYGKDYSSSESAIMDEMRRSGISNLRASWGEKRLNAMNRLRNKAVIAQAAVKSNEYQIASQRAINIWRQYQNLGDKTTPEAKANARAKVEAIANQFRTKAKNAKSMVGGDIANARMSDVVTSSEAYNIMAERIKAFNNSDNVITGVMQLGSVARDKVEQYKQYLTNLLGTMAFQMKNTSGQLVNFTLPISQGKINWEALHVKLKNLGVNVASNLKSHGNFLIQLFDMIKNNTELAKKYADMGIAELAALFDPINVGDKVNRKDWHDWVVDWYNGTKYKGGYKNAEDFYKNGKWMNSKSMTDIRSYNLNKMTGGEKIKAPGTDSSSDDSKGYNPSDQSAYDSKYNRNAARPTQIIFNIDNLCRFDNTKVNTESQQQILHDLQAQIAQGVGEIFAQAASELNIVGEGGGAGA